MISPGPAGASGHQVAQGRPAVPGDAAVLTAVRDVPVQLAGAKRARSGWPVHEVPSGRGAPLTQEAVMADSDETTETAGGEQWLAPMTFTGPMPEGRMPSGYWGGAVLTIRPGTEPVVQGETGETDGG